MSPMHRASMCAALFLVPRLLGGQMAQASPSLTPRDSALHALNRLAYGPRPGDVTRVAQMGVMKWIDQQLDPRHVDDDSLKEIEKGYQILHESSYDLVGLLEDARKAREE